LAYRFRKEEPISAGIRRIARERVDKALGHLSSDRDDGVHEARKRFKEIRAVLRLASHALGDRFVIENRRYRDLGRALSEARDAQAAVETWDKLCARFRDEIGETDARAVHRRLQLRRRDVLAGDADGGPGSGRVSERLAAAREAIAGWRFSDSRFVIIQEGLVEHYAKGRRGLRRAYAGGRDEQFHAWRKRIKNQWYHTTLLEPVWEAGLGTRKKSLKALSDLVGDDHDLAVFSSLLAGEPQLFGLPASRQTVASLIAIRQAELRGDAHELGSLLYAEKPKAFGRRIAAYWSAWKANGSD